MHSAERRTQLEVKPAEAPTPVVAENVVRLNTASWETTKGVLELRTHNNDKTHSFFLNHTDQIRDYYDEIYKKFVRGERIAKSVPKEVLFEDGEAFVPGKILDSRTRAYSPLLRIVRETVTRNIERRSKGYKKRIRAEKAAQRKNQPFK